MTFSKTPEPVEICWRVLEASSTRILTCAIFSDPIAGVELRLGYLVDVPLHSRMMRDIDSARALAKNWLDAVRAAANQNESWITPMTFRCLDCQLPIKGDPWWYDPSAAAITIGLPPPTLTGVVFQQPDPPTPVSAPFHKECLERQMGRSIHS
jgi:hypothetical protein